MPHESPKATTDSAAIKALNEQLPGYGDFLLATQNDITRVGQSLHETSGYRYQAVTESLFTSTKGTTPVTDEMIISAFRALPGGTAE